MAVLKKATLFLLAFSFLCSASVFADEASIREEINQLKERIATLEKISEYETKLSKFEENLHEIPGIPMKLTEGLELGAGGTMIVQGTNNTNNAASDVTKKEGRADASYSADITLGVPSLVAAPSA